MIVLFTGLPGTGKTYLARAVSDAIASDILNRDLIRNAIFPARDLDYTSEQNELASQVLYRVAEYILRHDPTRVLIFDGRPFTRQEQVAEVVRLAEGVGHELRVIHCTAPDEVAHARLMADLAHKVNVPEDRSVAKYRRIKQANEPLMVPHLVVDTTRPLEECVEETVRYVGASKQQE